MDNDRLIHSIAVARKMVSIGAYKGMSEIELQELFILGLNHDIGYEFAGGDNHGINGAKALKSSGYKYYKEVYYHGIPSSEYKSLYLDILNVKRLESLDGGRARHFVFGSDESQ